MRDRRLRLLLLLPLVLLALGEFVLASNPPFADDPIGYTFEAVTGVALGVAGLLLWSRRPAAKTGPLLVVAGWLWYIGDLHNLVPDHPAPAVLGLIPFFAFALRGYYDLILAFVVLSFPGRRLGSRVDRLVVVGLTGVMAVRSLWRLVGTQPGFGSGYPATAPANPLLLVHDTAMFIAVDQVLTNGVAIAMAAIAVAALLRIRRLRPGARRATTPVLLGGAAWAAMVSAYTLDLYLHQRLGIDIVPWDGPGWTAQYLLRLLGPIGLLVGALRLRGGSATAVALMAGAAGAPRGADLEQGLRVALGDPALTVVRAWPDGGWRDSAGRPVGLPGDDGDRATTLLERDGTAIGAITHDATWLDDPAFVRTVAAVVALAVDNDELQAGLRAQLEEVRVSRARIVEAGDAERRRVERDLHDGAQQRLVALAVSLRTIRSRLGADIPPPVAQELDAATDLVKTAIAEVRALARGLDPSILREAGLAAAVQSLADHSPIPVHVAIEVDGRLPSSTETAAYFVAAEAMANAAKHSEASLVTVSASRTGGLLNLEVADNGAGGADVEGSGIRGLADRIAAVGGTFRVDSAPGDGTRIRASIPCAS